MKRIKYLTPTEVERFISKIESLRDKTMFSLMYTYGLRCVELSDLKKEDVSFAENRIFISAAKSGITGMYFLPKNIQTLLKKYSKSRKDQSLALFPSQKSSKLGTRQIRRLFVDYAKKARIPLDRQHPHVLRHSIAVHMADSGVDVATVQMHLRHKDIKNTMKYFVITNRARDLIQEKALTGEFLAKI